MSTRRLAGLAQLLILAGMLLVFIGAIATARVEPAERPHWPSRPATIQEQLIHDNEQQRALENPRP